MYHIHIIQYEISWYKLQIQKLSPDACRSHTLLYIYAQLYIERGHSQIKIN